MTKSAGLFFIALCAFSIQAPAMEPLTLEQAILSAMDSRPELDRAAADVGIRKAERDQAALYPNPAIAAEIEDVGGDHQYHGFGYRQTTYSIAQPIDVAGKRCKRSQQRAYELSTARWDYQSAVLDLRRDVIQAMVEVAAAQEALRIATEQAKVSGNMFSSINAMVEAGKVSPLSGSKADIERRQLDLAQYQARRHLRRTIDTLALLVGEECPCFEEVVYPFFDIVAPECLNAYKDELENNPDLSRWDAEIMAAQQGITAEKSEAIPDVTVMGGFRQYGNRVDPSGRSSYAWVAAVEVPLPVWDHNQGNIERAHKLLCKAENERATAELNLTSELSSAYEELANAYEQAMQYQTSILTEAEKAFQSSIEGYRQGKFEYLDVLDAQRTLFDVQADYIDMVTLYHQRLADINRLIGM